jgi:hypothetical protein
MVYPICPRCRGAAVPLLVGQLGPVHVEASRAGRLALGGSFVSEDGTDPNWWCTARGHLWHDGDEALWEAAVAEAVAGRPYCPRCGSPSRLRIDADAAEQYEQEIHAGQAVVVTGYVLPGASASA